MTIRFVLRNSLGCDIATSDTMPVAEGEVVTTLAAWLRHEFVVLQPGDTLEIVEA